MLLCVCAPSQVSFEAQHQPPASVQNCWRCGFARVWLFMYCATFFLVRVTFWLTARRISAGSRMRWWKTEWDNARFWAVSNRKQLGGSAWLSFVGSTNTSCSSSHVNVDHCYSRSDSGARLELWRKSWKSFDVFTVFATISQQCFSCPVVGTK